MGIRSTARSLPTDLTRRHSACLAFAALLLSSPLAGGQAAVLVEELPQAPIPHVIGQQPATLSGLVTDLEGVPIIGAALTLTPAEGSAPALETASDADGRFFVTGLVAGVWTLQATFQGFDTASSTMALQPGQTLALPPIALRISSSWKEMLIGIDAYNERMLFIIPPVIGFDHSFFGFFKILVQKLLHLPITKGLGLGYLVVLACFAVPAFFLVIRKMPLLNQMLIMIGVCTFLSPCSYTYTLIELYIPWAPLVLASIRSRNRTDRGLNAMMICFACMVAPYSEFIVRRSVAGQVRALTIPFFFYLVFKYRFPYFEEKRSGDLAQASAPLSAEQTLVVTPA